MLGISIPRFLIPFAAYLLGSIPFGLLLTKLFGGGDVRKAGSGNIGATNVTRVVGPLGGILTLVLDTAKGADLGSDGPQIVIDFNFMYHPSCRYDPRWVCPLAPPENTIDVPINAGERLTPP